MGDLSVVGIDFGPDRVRVFAPNGVADFTRRAARTPAECIAIVRASVGSVPPPLCAMIALPVGTDPETRDVLLRMAVGAGKCAFDSVQICTAPHALARKLDVRRRVAIVVDRIVSSVAIVGESGAAFREVDSVRPIPGREARELAIAVRCLVKNKPPRVRAGLLEGVVVGGDPAEITRLGPTTLAAEFRQIGARLSFVDDPFAVAEGARALGLDMDGDAWSVGPRKAPPTKPLS